MQIASCNLLLLHPHNQQRDAAGSFAAWPRNWRVCKRSCCLSSRGSQWLVAVRYFEATSQILCAAAVLEQQTSMASSDALRFCCNGAALLLFTSPALGSPWMAATVGGAQADAMSAIISLALDHEMLKAFAARLDPVQLAAWLGTAADALQGEQAQQRRGAFRAHASSYSVHP